MTDTKHTDDVTGVDTTGHQWDDIRELNNPLPKWWVYTFYASIVWSVVYWIVMPAWPIFMNGAWTYTGAVQPLATIAHLAMARVHKAQQASPTSMMTIGFGVDHWKTSTSP